jgi:endonuclease/exonuclease/phosphatase family metal-dependent hydrolase
MPVPSGAGSGRCRLVILTGMQIRALTWNLYHGRDFPPDPSLWTKRSRLLRITERSETHVQVNRSLFADFAELISSATWDVALLQECPPRWARRLAERSDADAHRVLTSRNSFAPLRRLGALLNPDLIGSNEGGSNLTLVRRSAGVIVERRELVIRPGPDPERRTMAFTRLRRAEPAARHLCVANLHASAGAPLRVFAEQEALLAAERSVEWAGESPLIFGGDLNLRPAETDVYDRVAERFGLREPTAPDSLDHLLARGLEAVGPPRVWAPEEREVRKGGLAIRLADHAPVEATFSFRAGRPEISAG